LQAACRYVGRCGCCVAHDITESLDHLVDVGQKRTDLVATLDLDRFGEVAICDPADGHGCLGKAAGNGDGQHCGCDDGDDDREDRCTDEHHGRATETFLACCNGAGHDSVTEFL